MNTEQNNHKKHQPDQLRRTERYDLDLRPQLIFCAVEAVLLLALALVLNISTGISDSSVSLYVSAFSLAFYLLSAGTVCIFFSIKYHKLKQARKNADRHDTVIYDLFRYSIDIPYALVDASGEVKVMNGALQDILGHKSAVSGVHLSEFCPIGINALASRSKNRDVYHRDPILDLPEQTPLEQTPTVRLADGKRYAVTSYSLNIQDSGYHLIFFENNEALLSLREKMDSQSTVVAYVAIDNLQELTKYIRADYRTAAAQVEALLEEWASSMNGFIREHERNEYIAIFPKCALDRQMAQDFPIQQKIMALSIGDNSFPVTVSMGISEYGDTLAEKEKYALTALSMAIGRGGNQVAVRKGDDHIFFGGTHKTMENNTSVVSRISASLIGSSVMECSNVLIMGHANPDFDSIGACVGMARFCMSVIDSELSGSRKKPSVRIVVDKSSETFRLCSEILSDMDCYDGTFISKEAALDLVGSDTLLIITDVNNQKIYECPDLADTVPNIAIIDHHRIAAEFTFNPFLQYIEATRSSSSEIVSEILEQSKFADTLSKEEATLLLAGIMLDTKNFTRNTGAQTFSLSHYLYNRGAHTEVAKELFRDDLDELLLTSAFESNARIYGEDRNIAISWIPDDHRIKPCDRTIVSKVADKLLSAKGIDAAFALVQIDDDVVISGRSLGKINVQLILERLKGGGHFNMAGAQLHLCTVSSATDLLLGAIDDYYKYDHKTVNAED